MNVISTLSLSVTPLSPGFSLTSYITEQVTKKICETLEIRPPIFDISLFTTAMKERGKSLEWLTRIGYDLRQKESSHYHKVELSNLLLNLEIASLVEIEDFGLIKSSVVDHLQVSYDFHEESLQCYFAGLYLANNPIMHVHKFVNSLQILNRSKWKILEFYFGLVSAGVNPVARDGLYHVLNYISQSFNVNRPFVNNEYVLLILRCLYEANDDSLSLQVFYELLKSQVFAYSLSELSESINSLAYYLTIQDETMWRIYCPDKSMANELMSAVRTFQIKKNKKETNVTVKKEERMCFGDPQRIVITTRSVDYVITSLRQTEDDGKISEELSIESSAAVTGDVLQRMTPSFSSPSPSSSFLCDVTLLPYGHLSEQQFRGNKQVGVVVYFNLLRDLMVPHLQVYSNLFIQSQYRKSDHNWYVFAKNMRHDFYEAVSIDPIIPIHWVKVKQPDGSPELEEKFKLLSDQRYQSTTSTEEESVAELVLLNSTRLIHFTITPPTGENPVIIALYRDSEDRDEPGFIGCSFHLDKCIEEGPVKWRAMKLFDDIEDEKIVCLLPLPSNKETEPGEMTANTAAANVKSMESSTAVLKIPPFKERPLATPARPSSRLSPSAQMIPVSAGPALRYMSEHQLKQHALIGFEQPGYCFYGDGDRFVAGKIYTEPNKLPRARILREGGNGLVLEVTFEGITYAVKRTAFRWREVLIMPKLHHNNILRLIALLMGPPIEYYPRRRYIFHFYPKMTNDLGRSVGSYERYCLRSLRERYKNESLLLKKIHNNFRNLFTCLLEALNYLHTLPSPVIHRDVKPSNILLLMTCDCPNVLACVCRKTPEIVLSDFDASLELHKDGTLQPDTSSKSTSEYHVTSTDSTYHISPVGTIGFKSPEGSMYSISNSVELVRHFNTKVDIFSFGVLACLLTMNEEGPKFMNQLGTLLLSIHKVPSPHLTDTDKVNLQKNGVTQWRPREPYVTDKDLHRILPITRLHKSFHDIPHLIDFIQKSLLINPRERPTAEELLSHPYITAKTG